MLEREREREKERERQFTHNGDLFVMSLVGWIEVLFYERTEWKLEDVVHSETQPIRYSYQ